QSEIENPKSEMEITSRDDSFSQGLVGLPRFAGLRGLALQLTAPSQHLSGFDALDVECRVEVLERIPEPLRFGPTIPRCLHPLMGHGFSHGRIELPGVSNVRHRRLPGERARPPGPTDGQRV